MNGIESGGGGMGGVSIMAGAGRRGLLIRKYRTITATSLQNNLAYASNFCFEVVFYVFIIFIFLQLWTIVYGNGGTIEGYGRSGIVWYFIVTEMIMLSGSNVFNELGGDIKGGNIAYLLTRPYHYLFYQLFNALGVSAVKLVINLAAGTVMGLLFVGPIQGLRLWTLPLTILSVFAGMLINFFMQASIGLTAFWAEDNAAFFWIYSKLVFILGMLMPVEFLPEWLRKLTLYLPFSYVTYGPAKLCVNFSGGAFTRIALMQAGYLAVTAAAAFAIYSKGVRKLNVNGG